MPVSQCSAESFGHKMWKMYVKPQISKQLQSTV